MAQRRIRARGVDWITGLTWTLGMMGVAAAMAFLTASDLNYTMAVMMSTAHLLLTVSLSMAKNENQWLSGALMLANSRLEKHGEHVAVEDVPSEPGA